MEDKWNPSLNMRTSKGCGQKKKNWPQNMGQEAKARPQRGWWAVLEEWEDLGGKQGLRRTSQRRRFLAAGPGKTEAFLLLLMLGLLSLLSGSCAFSFSGLAILPQVRMLGVCVLTVPWGKWIIWRPDFCDSLELLCILEVEFFLFFFFF